MAVWLFGFCLGVFAGRGFSGAYELRSALPAGFLLLVFAGVPCLFFAKRRAQFGGLATLTLAVAAAFWGFAHAAPVFVGEPTEGTVVDASSSLADYTPVLVEAKGGVYETAAAASVGAMGELSYGGGVSPFSEGRDRFLVRFDPRRLAHEPLMRGVLALREAFHRRLGADSPFMRDWLSGILLGERTALPRKVTLAFKATGTYHLLAVSGLHVSLIALLLSLGLRLPFHAGYALRLIPAHDWRHYAGLLNVGAAVMAIFYLAVTGMPAAAQRATLTFVIVQLGAAFTGSPPLRVRLLLAATLQSLVFPIGFVSEGSFMSWAAYLIVLEAFQLRPATPRAAARLVLFTQFKLTMAAAVAFGQLPLLGLVANLFLVPVFSLLLGLGLLAAVVGPMLPGRNLILALHASFIEIVIRLGELAERFSWLFVTGEGLPVVARLGATVILAWILLNTVRNLSISSYEAI